MFATITDRTNGKCIVDSVENLEPEMVIDILDADTGEVISTASELTIDTINAETGEVTFEEEATGFDVGDILSPHAEE